MNKELSALRNTLNDKLMKNQTGVYGRVGKCNDSVLQLLLSQICKNPCVENFICFTQVLNALYNTRLQSNEKGKPNETIVTVAEVLRSNWQNGCMLSEVCCGSPVRVEKVEILRYALKKVLKKDYFSFVTKVFHQLNNQYPIKDSRIQSFMINEFSSIKINFDNKVIIYSDFYDAFKEMMSELDWDTNKVDEIDIAIWQFEADRPKEN